MKTFTPRPWQVPMIDFLSKTMRANLWAPMGSGKTSAVYTVLSMLQLIDNSFAPTLALAPMRVARDVWPDERDEFSHLQDIKVVPIIGDEKTRRMALHQKAHVYTMNYENIPWLVEQLGDKWPFKTIIADESTKLKGFRLRVGAKRASALAQVARKTQRWYNLTGTPSPNGYQDLWGQAWFLDYGQRLGKSWTAFKERWFDYDPYTMALTPKPFAAEQIIKALSDITLSIDMSDYIDIQQPVISRVYVDLPTAAKAQYKKLEKEMFVEISEGRELTALSAAAKTTKCLQFAAGAVYYDENKNWVEVHDRKLEALESIVEETAGANILVSYWWKHDLARLLKRFPKARQLQTTKDQDDWNAGKIGMLLAHPMSAGHGLNLQHGGHHIVFFSDWWQLETRLQIFERLGPLRQLQSGYKRPVFLYEIIARGTTDELVSERQESKAEIQTILMNAMKRRNV